MNYQRRIVRAPKICGGEPVIEGTRVTLRTMLASLAEGATTAAILSDFPTLSETDGAACDSSSFSFDGGQDGCCDRFLLFGRPFSWCPPQAFDETSGECSQCFGDPCEGLPTRTPTSTVTKTGTVTSTATVTPTPTVTPTFSAVDFQIQDVIADVSAICVDSSSIGPYLTTECGSQTCRFDCNYSSGHGGGARLQRFATSDAAAQAFDEFRLDAPVGELHALPAFFAVYPWNHGYLEGTTHWGAFRSDCWLATAMSYDDTHFQLGAPPEETLELIYQRGTAIGLFAECEAAPPAAAPAVSQ